MSFTPGDIGYFLEIARQQHFGRAARHLGLTQPAMTKAVRRLEASVGVALFERGGGGARLTPQGHLFLEAARRFDRQHAELQRVADELRAQHTGLLRVGITYAHGRSLVVKVLSELVRQRPGLRLSLHMDRSDRLNDGVERGEFDAAVAPSYPGEGFSCSQLALDEERVLVAARVGHPLFSGGPPALQDLQAFGWVLPDRDSAARRLLTQIFERAGAPTPRVVMEVEYVSAAVLGMVAATDLLAPVPASVLQDWAGQVHALPLPALEFHRTLVLLTRPQTSWTPLLAAFRDALLAHRPSARPAR